MPLLHKTLIFETDTDDAVNHTIRCCILCSFVFCHPPILSPRTSALYMPNQLAPRTLIAGPAEAEAEAEEEAVNVTEAVCDGMAETVVAVALRGAVALSGVKPSGMTCAEVLVAGAYHQSVVIPTGKVYLACWPRNSMVVETDWGFQMVAALSSQLRTTRLYRSQAEGLLRPVT